MKGVDIIKINKNLNAMNVQRKKGKIIMKNMMPMFILIILFNVLIIWIENILNFMAVLKVIKMEKNMNVINVSII